MIVGRSEDYTSDDPLLNPPIVEGQANPMRRDTVHIPSMGSITLRVVADNPGTWMLHCKLHLYLLVLLLTYIIRPYRMASSSRSRHNTNRGPARGSAAQHPPASTIRQL